MTKEELIELGFDFDVLSQGTVNIKHPKCFILNSVRAVSRKNGFFFRSLEVPTINQACKYIITIEILD